MVNKQWSELDPGARQAIMLAGAFEAGLKVAALIDLVPRAPSEVRGSKKLWAAGLVLVNSVGVLPILYLLRGRSR